MFLFPPLFLAFLTNRYGVHPVALIQAVSAVPSVINSCFSMIGNENCPLTSPCETSQLMLAVTKFIRGPPELFQIFVKPVCGIDTLNPFDCAWSQSGDFGNSNISAPEGPFTAILTNLNSRSAFKTKKFSPLGTVTK
jgi:hypothetical protein